MIHRRVRLVKAKEKKFNRRGRGERRGWHKKDIGKEMIGAVVAATV
jgi:hypothetical protein